MRTENLSGERVAERANGVSVNITQQYFNDLELYPLLTKEQEVDLGRQVQAGIAAQTVIIENPTSP